MEILKSIIVVTGWVLAADLLVAQSGWRGLQPGISTRPQVERVTGPPSQALTDTLTEYKGAQPSDRLLVQYRSGGVAERIEVILGAPIDRTAAQSELALPANPEVTKSNSRGKTEEFYGFAMVVLTLGNGRVERYAFYSSELFEASGGKRATAPPSSAATAATLTANAPKPPPAEKVSPARELVTIPAATRLAVRLIDKLSTNTNKAGDRFRATLDQDLSVNGSVIAAKGAEVEGKITVSTKSGRVKGLGEMHLELTSLRLATGQIASISTGAFMQTAESSASGDAKKTAAATAIGAAIGAIAGGGKGAAIGAGAGAGVAGGAVLLTRGKPAELSVEALLSFQLTAPVVIH